MTDLTDSEKKMLLEAIGAPMGEAMKVEMPKLLEKADANKKEYIERLTRIEAKLDALLMTLKVVTP